MKILWLSHFIPYPPRGGAHQRSFNLIHHLSQKADVSLVALNHEGHPQSRLSEYVRELRKSCVDVEVWEMPYRWRGLRWWMQLGLSPVDRYPMGCRGRWSRHLGARWSEILKRHADSLIHFDSIDLALFAGAARTFRKVLNHHNCESAMVKRRAQLEHHPIKKRFLQAEAAKLEQLERAICSEFNANVTVSELDAELIQTHSPGAHCHVVENGTDTNFFTPSATDPEPDSLIFSGSLSWYPNQSAIRYFDEKIWPLLKQQRPGVRLYVAGQKPPPWMFKWAERDPSITLVPNPADMRPWQARASVFICPIVDGGGTRLKILDSMAMGKAVVTTSVGCEGLLVKNGEHLLVADDPSQFAGHILRMLSEPAFREQIARNGRSLVERMYSWEVITQHLHEAYQCAVDPASCALRSSQEANDQ